MMAEGTSEIGILLAALILSILLILIVLFIFPVHSSLYFQLCSHGFCYWNWRGARLVFFDVPRSFLRISCSHYHRHCDCWFRLLVARRHTLPSPRKRFQLLNLHLARGSANHGCLVVAGQKKGPGR